MRENTFQSNLIKELKTIFDGCIILKNDPNYKQGIPDLLILYKDRWAALECKRSNKSSTRPNQQYYIDILNNMSYAAIINPENKEEIINDIKRSFGLER